MTGAVVVLMADWAEIRIQFRTRDSEKERSNAMNMAIIMVDDNEVSTCWMIPDEVGFVRYLKLHLHTPLSRPIFTDHSSSSSACLFRAFATIMGFGPLRSSIRILCITLGVPVLLYVAALGALVSAPSLQIYAIYRHKAILGSPQDLNSPEQFGFAHRQVTPFYISTTDGEELHAWHVLPLGPYMAHQRALLEQGTEGGLVENIENTLNFELLKNNPDARLVISFHGASGNMASYTRPDGYRSIYATDPANTHVLAFDYRGFGKSTGHPSELGLIADARAVAEWALNTAGIPAERIVIHGQSMGSAVATSLVHDFVTQREPPIYFAGLVLTAPFMSVAQLTTTYRIASFIPVLSPVAKIKSVFDFFVSRLTSTWDNMRRLSEIVERAERYDIAILHAEDDPEVPAEHAVKLFKAMVQAVEGAKVSGESEDEKGIADKAEGRKESRAEGGSFMTWSNEKGDITLEILKYGLHDKLLTYPATGLAISRAFRSVSGCSTNASRKLYS